MTRDVADTLEDLTFLDGTLVGAVEAAQRTGFPTCSAMEMWLRKHDRVDLWQRLKRRDPAGTHLSGSDRKRRLMSVTHQPQPTDPTAALLREASEHPRKSIQNRGHRIASLLSDLRAELDQDREQRAAAAEARAEVQRLEQELADARARLRGGPAPSSTSAGSDASLIRSWATEHGLECPARGRVPQHVRDAYEARDGQVADAS